MLQATIIGNLGAAPESHQSNGNDFISFRIAHNDTYTGQDGQSHTNVVWVDCIMNGQPKVAEFLLPGTQVYVTGDVRLRVYSSAAERCMKAGMTIQVRSIQLIGSRPDMVPSRLYDSDGQMHEVKKYYQADCKSTTLLSQKGQHFSVDKQGWVYPVQEQTANDKQQ